MISTSINTSYIGNLAKTPKLSNYSSYFAQLANFADPFLFTVLLAIVAIIITLLAAVATDFIGRRTLFIGATLVIWCCLMIIGGLGLMKERSHAINQLAVSGSNCKVPSHHSRAGLFLPRLAHGIHCPR